ncbi:nucleoside-diphosphate-sugar epimerase [Geomicrobium halophilum]|uniref:Nucleoside-diphosphate-sugar epimerase n=1 Tax=Geomicrobium halophilum TaxID=549000 RepID=A0A841PPF6_9BACL|nr:NAD-dependent epimerase/dehydratase family protein [Geomicrobium halophilum]MBB6450717.1 nucleoside-diphosphate-sugar epimerase [Geomicrobium halophilum]
MKKILITGASGQIGSELTLELRKQYGEKNVIATDIRDMNNEVSKGGIFHTLDVTEGGRIQELVRDHQVDTIIHLAALLSANAENQPLNAWNLNMGGLMNTLEVAREQSCTFFTPSSIGAFGPSTVKEKTPQVTVQRPTTMYGVSKVASELLCDYYHEKFGVDTRGLRYPGLISYLTAPGGGTTDYAIEMFYKAISDHHYSSYIAEGTFLDMMYMPDAIAATIDLLEANPAKLINRNAYNITAMSIDPKMLADAIRTHIPDFKLDYDVDPERQKIAESWPDHIDTSAAVAEFGFRPRYDLETMATEMIQKISHNHLNLT